MEIKIEDVEMCVNAKSTREEFWLTVKQLKVGQSFVIPPHAYNSNIRNGLTIAEILLDRKFATRKAEAGRRIGRIA